MMHSKLKIWAQNVLSLCFITLLSFSTSTFATSEPFSSAGFGGGSEEEILSVDEAFKLSTSLKDGQLVASWEIADGHYLYRDKTSVTPTDPDVSAGPIDLDTGELKNDEFFGEIYVYHHNASARLPIIINKDGAKSATFNIKYQGCSEVSGICYPPESKTVILDLSPMKSVQAATTSNNAAPPSTEQDRIADSLKSGSTWLTILSFFGFGLLLAFTPCVFPMIPILSSIIVGQGDKISTRNAFTLSVVYVLAMAVTYTVAGIVAGLFGENLQATFQNPWILGSFAGVFVLLSLSMFGFYELQMPNFIQSRLTEYSNKQQGGTLTGVAIMGFLSALIVGPCVAAPLAGALIYIGQTGDAVLGGFALFALSMGMGAPLIAIGTSAGKFMPKAGIWMDVTKAVFGVMLLAVAIWMLERVIPATVTLMLWGVLLVVSSIYMGALEGLQIESSGWKKFWKGMGLILFTYGILLLVGASSGSTDMLQPLKGLSAASSTGQQADHNKLQFSKIKGIDGLEQALTKARANNQPVMVDFYADWCVSCKEMEKFTFSDSQVQAALKNTLLLKADVTANDQQDKELYKRFGIIGPPAIIFYNSQGTEMRNYRVVGYMPAEKFTSHINQAIN
ncbi:MAG: protein-disulfide reductase DsbD [Gammaproteobacteria bacterium]|nr:protein-disulfide reductase DsbD [Gammaproteobacteria bacterium]MCW8910166.1 protein-disulfide reductase DsbD [Gammaproteobacteria bacterium]MCW9055453.1 protein-disulfide reductase DsbD [Gammaproteobacteria bacterium]